MNRLARAWLLAIVASAAFSAAGKGPLTSLPTSAASAASGASSASRALDESQLLEHGHYRNSSGAIVHSPAHTQTGAVPSGATAQCRDASYSFSQHRSGTCSHHGGVALWF